MTVWILLLVLVMLFWGGSFIAIKHVVRFVTPLELVPLRFLPVALAFGLWLALKHRSTCVAMIRADWWRLMVIGLTGAVLYNIFLGWGETRVPAGTASLIISLNPAFIYTLSVLVLREQLVWRRISGMALAFCGLFIIIRFGSGRAVTLNDVTYALITVMAPVMWAIYTVSGKALVRRQPPLLVTAVSMVFAGLFSLMFLNPPLLAGMRAFPLSLWWSVLFLSFPCTVFGFAVWFGALKQMPAGRVAGFVYLVPLFGVLLSRLVLNEPISLYLAVGALVLIGGVWLVSRR